MNVVLNPKKIIAVFVIATFLLLIAHVIAQYRLLQVTVAAPVRAEQVEAARIPVRANREPLATKEQSRTKT